jgi:hypothetical protein
MNGSDLIPALEKIKPYFVNENHSEIVQYFQNNKFKMDALMFISMHNNKVYKKLKDEYETFKRKYSTEINNLNRTIIKKKNIINDLTNDLKKHKTDIYKIVNNKVNEHKLTYKEEIRKLKEELLNEKELNNQLKLENKLMKDDYENFKVIKRFEIIKLNLQKYVDNLNDINELNFFLTNINNKDLLESLFDTDFDNIISKYHELRINRNNIAHLS